MSYTALARKWRPRKFSEVIGQEHVVAALTNALKNQKVHHAFLFTGTRGVGKTTLARIFAKALNCEKGVNAEPCCECNHCVSVDEGRFVDLIEVDAASRTKVDDTRDLLDNVQYKPTQGRFKIYLIDEVHMLSTHSFNALLKTLEEPPEHVKFLLATTDPNKLPTTVLSRCIQFNLKSMDIPLLMNQLKTIVRYEKVLADDAALELVAKAANGSVRDALSLMDQAIAYSDGRMDAAVIRDMLGMIEQHYIDDLLYCLAQSDVSKMMSVIQDVAQTGRDYLSALDELLTCLHHIALYQFSADTLSWKSIDVDNIKKLSGLFSADELQLYYQIGLHGKRDLAYAPDPRTGFEMTLLRMLAFKPASASSEPVQQANVTHDRPSQAGSSPSNAEFSVQRPSSARKPIQEQPPLPEPEEISAMQPDIEPTSENNAGSATKTAAVSGFSALKRQLSENRKAESNDNIVPSSPSNKMEDSVEADDNSVNRPVRQTISPPPQTEEAPQTQQPPMNPAVADSGSSSDQNAETTLPAITAENILNPKGWVKFVHIVPFGGIHKQLVMNMTPVALDNGVLRFHLDEQVSQLFNDDRQRKIADIVSGALTAPVKLHIECVKLDEAVMTPYRYIQRKQAQNLADAQEAVLTDPDVQQIVDLFDATVDIDSIRPA